MPKKIFFSLFCICSFFLWGCTSSQSTRVTSPSLPPKPIYTGTEFPDIVIPTGMSVIQSKSLLVKTPSYIGGVLTLKGRIKVGSLVDFFKTQLINRGWKLSGSIISDKTLLAFNSSQGSCFIYITEPGMGVNTEVQIWASEQLGEH